MIEQGRRGERLSGKARRKRSARVARNRRERERDKERDSSYPAGARGGNVFPDGTRITVETRKIMKLVPKSVRANII